MVENVAIKPGDVIQSRYFRHDNPANWTCRTYGVVAKSELVSGSLSLRYIAIGNVYPNEEIQNDSSDVRVEDFSGQQVPSEEETTVFTQSTEYGRYDLQKIDDTEVPDAFQARLRSLRFRY